ncbi:hypothetical protein LCGC14_3168910 [marine sediment metagenome]|uniref:Uncharacterized protein n=1 Tax=marine sediment metagenome TaxID=412755 RepID=A0A0F8XVA2_9ZZZZ
MKTLLDLVKDRLPKEKKKEHYHIFLDKLRAKNERILLKNYVNFQFQRLFYLENKAKWLKFENVLLNNEPRLSPDELSALYIEVTDHLSYAQTFYPDSKTAEYLNHLASQSHQKIYKAKRESSRRFITFFTEEFPLLFYNYQKQLLLAFSTFALFCIITSI